MANVDVAQGMIDAAFTDQSQSNPVPPEALVPTTSTSPEPQYEGGSGSFAKDFFGVDSPDQILRYEGEHPNNPDKVVYTFLGDGKKYSARKDKPLEQVLETIWDKKSPGLWGAAKGQTLYGLPADMASAVAYGLGGLGLDGDAQDWRGYSDKLKEEYHQKYGQFMTPGIEAAIEHGKTWDYALQALGTGAPYMGLALTGGALGIAGAGATGAALTTEAGGATAASLLGSFLGSTAITSPVTIAQFADRQVAQMREQGIENPESKIDWAAAAGLGILASGLQALPVESILFGGPLLRTLTNWGAKTGTPVSARMLGSIADIAGTNALASSGAAFLSRANADMPLLDDDAKSEYLDAAIMGSLVGIPFGIYKGVRHQPPRAKLTEAPKPLDQILNENTEATTETPSSNEVKTEEPTKKTLGRRDVLFDPNEDYGIRNADEAAKYLDSISYTRAPGEAPVTGLTDFIDRYDRTDRTFSDAEIVDQARRVKRVRDLQDHLKKTKNGVLYEDLNALPQVHSNDPGILTKAAALADRWGYDDAHVRGMSDALITKLFDLNIKKELRSLAERSPKDVYESVLNQMRNHVDQQVVKDSQDYGGLYQRPLVKSRFGKSLEERRAALSKNPRKQLAELLVKTRQEKAGDKAYSAFLGDRGPGVVRLPDLTKAPDFVEPPPVDGEAFSDYAGMRKLPMGPRALLEYKPARRIDEANLVDVLQEASKRPGSKTPDGLSKAEFNDMIMGLPWVKHIVNEDPTLQEVRAAIARGKRDRAKEARKEAKAKDLYPEPKLDKDGNPILKPDGSFSRTRPLGKEKQVRPHLRSEDAEHHLKQIRDRLEEIATKERQEFLKAHPEVFRSIDALTKRFAELAPDIRVPSQTGSVKGAFGLMESLSRRASVLRSISQAFETLSPNLSRALHDSLNDLLVGKPVDAHDLANVVSVLEMSLGNRETLDVTGTTKFYVDARATLDPKKQQALDSKRHSLDDWYTSEHGMNPRDVVGLKPADMEANAFYRYMRGDLKTNYKKFKGSPQQKYFAALEKAMNRIKKELEDQGFTKTTDLLEYNKSTKEPIPQVTPQRIAQEVNHQQAENKVVEQGATVQQAANEAQANTSYDHFAEPPKEVNGGKEPPILGGFANNAGGTMWKMWDIISSIPAKARAYPAWAAHYQNQVEVKQREASNNLRMSNKLSTVWDQHGWPKINEACEVLAYLRKSDQKLVKDDNGRYIYIQDGVQKALTPEMTSAIDGVVDFTREAMRMGDQVYRENLALYKEEGLDPTSSLAHIKRVIDNYDKKIIGNPFAEDRARYQIRKAGIEQVYGSLQEFNAHVQSDVPYVPFLRFGDYVAQVVDKRTGNTVYMPALNDQNKFGSKARLPDEKEARQRMEALGIFKKYGDKSKYDIRHFQMTYNNISKFINNGAVSTELLQGLIASGINENMKVADHLATGVENYKEVMGDISSSVKHSKDRAMRYLAAKGIGRFSIKSENIDGHSTDWARVLDSYKNIWSGQLAKQSMMAKMVEDQAALQSEQGIPDHVRKQITKYLDYVNSPESDWDAIRSFSFTFAMGYNPSSALLQLATLPNQALGLSLAYSPNLINNAGILGSEMKKALQYSRGKKGVYDQATRDLIESEPGYFRASIREDALKSKVLGVQQESQAWAKTKQALGKVPVIGKLEPGFMIAPVERFTRIATYNLYKRLFDENPEALQRALKYRADDNNWQAYWKINQGKHDLPTAMALYSMIEPHAVYGKEARGTMQKGVAGAVFFPFTSYAMQMLEVLGEQLTMKYGMPGLYTGLWSMTTFMAMAGMAGIPGYELLKTLYEQYERTVNGRTVDAEMEMKEAGIPLWARKGLISTATGYDVSARLGQDIIGQNILLGLMKGELKTGELGGVPGRTLQNLLASAGEALSPTSTKSPMELVAPLLPAGLSNMAKAYTLATEPEKSLQTKTGKMLGDPSEVGAPDVIRQGLGFASTKLGEERQQLFWQQRANQEFNLYKTRLAEGVANAKYKIIQGSRQGDQDMVKEGRAQLEALRKQLVSYTKENNIPRDPAFWSSFNKNWQERLTQKMNPGRIRKPTLGERKHYDALTRDES